MRVPHLGARSFPRGGGSGCGGVLGNDARRSCCSRPTGRTRRLVAGPQMAAVVGVAVGAAVMSLPAPGSVAVVGMMTLGFLAVAMGGFYARISALARRTVISSLRARALCPANRCLPGAKAHGRQRATYPPSGSPKWSLGSPRIDLLDGEAVRRVIEAKRVPLCVGREVEPQVARVAQAGGEGTEVPEPR